MKRKFLKLSIGVLSSIVFLFVLSSCKDDEPVTKPTTDSTAKKEKGWALEIFAAMKDIYLWNTALPSKLDTTKYYTAETALEYLSSLKINPETNEAIDRYSFIDKIGNLSGEISGGTSSGDLGFMVTAAYNSSNQISFFVTYVYKNSPAGLAGVVRGSEVTSINGSTAVHPTVGSDGYLDSSSSGYVNMINALFYSTKASFTFKKPNLSTINVSLSTASYSINSILFDTVIVSGTKKIGYMVFNQFLGESSQTELASTISKFQSNAVEYLIVDLRYNGGGSVATCEKFSNLLVPTTANGKVMYSYKLNSILTEYYASQNASLVTNFEKTNTFSPTKLYFIVSGGTASASELLINNLRPYFGDNLQLIGETTYGKPCGFWATPIGYTEDQTTTKEGYDLYAISFETVNANNEGGYYSGMTPNTTSYPGVLANDYPFIAWGNTVDPCLSQALYHISTGTFKASTKASVKSIVQLSPTASIDRQFKGMIDFRKHR